jgi:uncharacterized protein YutD
VNFTPEITQFQLGDLAFKVEYCSFTCSSFSIKKLWDTEKAILTSIP